MDYHVVVGCHAAVGYRVCEPTRTVAVALFRFLLTPSHFHYPMGLTAWHMLFGSVISFFLCRVFKVRRQHEPEATSLARIRRRVHARKYDAGCTDVEHGRLYVPSMRCPRCAHLPRMREPACKCCCHCTTYPSSSASIATMSAACSRGHVCAVPLPHELGVHASHRGVQHHAQRDASREELARTLSCRWPCHPMLVTPKRTCWK